MTVKVLLTSSYWPPSIGGSQRYVSELAWVLVARYGCQVTVVTATEGAFDDGVDDGGVRVVRLPFHVRLSNTPIAVHWYSAIRRLLAETQPDVVNVHTPVPYLADLAFVAARSLPRVITYHNGTMRKDHWALDVPVRLYERFWLPRYFNSADAVVATYPQFVRRHAGEEADIVSIPPSVDPELFHPPASGDAAPDFDCLFVGRMATYSSWKGVDVLLRSVAAAAAGGTRLRLGLVGDGDALEHHRGEAERLGIASHTEFVGSRAAGDMPAVYRRAKVLVLPSTTDAEAFGIVLIEAMASGLPVVASDVGGIPNVVESQRTGLLVPPGDIDALAEALVHLSHNPEVAARMGATGRLTAVRRYNPEQLAEDSFRMLSRAAERRAEAPRTLTPLGLRPRIR